MYTKFHKNRSINKKKSTLKPGGPLKLCQEKQRKQDFVLCVVKPPHLPNPSTRLGNMEVVDRLENI